MSYGIAKVHGYSTGPQGFYGYQPLVLTVTGTGVGVTGIGSAFEAAIIAIEQRGSIVYIGTPSANSFNVILDAATVDAYNTANTDTDPTVALAALIGSATGIGNVAVSVLAL